MYYNKYYQFMLKVFAILDNEKIESKINFNWKKYFKNGFSAEKTITEYKKFCS